MWVQGEEMTMKKILTYHILMLPILAVVSAKVFRYRTIRKQGRQSTNIHVSTVMPGIGTLHAHVRGSA